MPLRKFETDDPRLLVIWDELQRIQTDFCFPQEIASFYTSVSWLGAQSVLDVGTGNAYFLERLARLFPPKAYRGIDISPELVKLAHARLPAGDFRFDVCDYFTAAGDYDFVVMRLFWQHVTRARLADGLDALLHLTHPGSSVLISDAYDEARHFVPDVPIFRDVIAQYTASQLRSGCDRAVVAQILEWARHSPQWRVGAHLTLTMPSSLDGYLPLYHRVYDLWLDLFEHVGEPAIDLTAARTELRHWKAERNAFTQAGLQVVRLDRVG